MLYISCHLTISCITKVRDQPFPADGTIKKIFNVINTALNQAEKMQLVTRNVASLIDRPQVKRAELKVWDIEECKKFLNEVRNKTRYYIPFFLAIYTGMRQGEILGLRWSDIDFENMVIRIRQTLSHDGKKFKAGAKTSSGNMAIAISTNTLSILKKHRLVIAQEKLNLGAMYSDHNLVVCTQNGMPLLPRSLSTFWGKLLKIIDVPKIKFHDLRHTSASLMLLQGVHPKVVSERLGHASIQLTLDTYSHLMPNMQKDAAKGLDHMLG
jgi:integrase